MIKLQASGAEELPFSFLSPRLVPLPKGERKTEEILEIGFLEEETHYRFKKRDSIWLQVTCFKLKAKYFKAEVLPL